MVNYYLTEKYRFDHMGVRDVTDKLQTSPDIPEPQRQFSSPVYRVGSLMQSPMSAPAPAPAPSPFPSPAPAPAPAPATTPTYFPDPAPFPKYLKSLMKQQ